LVPRRHGRGCDDKRSADQERSSTRMARHRIFSSSQIAGDTR
jgi:hypothetical protein